MEELGITEAEAQSFAWIVEYALQDDVLPQAWTKHLDVSSGNFYYIDEEAQTSTWETPLLPSLKRLVETGREYLQNPSEDFWEERKVSFWKDLKAGLEGWYGPLDGPHGRPYYANSLTGESSWRDPRVEAQWFYDLESTLLDSLEASMPAPGDLVVPGFGQRQSGTGDFWKARNGAEVLTLDAHPEPLDDEGEDFNIWGDEKDSTTPRVATPRQVSPTQRASLPTALGSLSRASQEAAQRPGTPRRLSAMVEKDSRQEQQGKLKSMLATFEWMHEVLQMDLDKQRRHIQDAAKARGRQGGTPAGLREAARSDSAAEHFVD